MAIGVLRVTTLALLSLVLTACGSGGGGGSDSAEPPSNPVPVAPAAPQALTAAAGNGEVSLRWSASTGAASYSVFMGTAAGGASSTAVRSGIAGTTSTVTGLSNGTTYYFVVRAVNAAGTSPASNEASATPVAPVLAPAAPAGLTATAGNGQIGLQWNASPGAATYSVFMGTAPGGESATATRSGIADTSTTVTGLTNGTTYYFVVRAVNTSGSSPASNEVSATPAGLGAGLNGLIACNTTRQVSYTASGLPIVQAYPGAPIVLYLDYDGGVYLSSDGSTTTYTGLDLDGNPSRFNAAEQEEILLSFERVAKYYAMFNVNVTTDPVVRDAAVAWSWALITEQLSGGTGKSPGVGRSTSPTARIGAGGSVRLNSPDKSRRVAHEIGHNFGLAHSGIWESGTFYKWEDYPGWDEVYGPVMGGGGKGARNGWVLGHSERSASDIQDDMAVIAKVITDKTGLSSGFRDDDFPEASPAALCSAGGGAGKREGIIETASDVDSFVLSWGGGPITITASAPDVSAALLRVEVRNDIGAVVAGSGTSTLPSGNYVIRVRSTSVDNPPIYDGSGAYPEYGAIGDYVLNVVP